MINRISKYQMSRDITDIILNSDKLDTFPLKLGKRQACPFLPLLFYIILEVQGSAARQGKGIKGIQIRKEEIKLSQFSENIIVYVENHKISTHKKEGTRISELSKRIRYKFNIQKSIKVLYTKNEQPEITINKVFEKINSICSQMITLLIKVRT